MYTLPVSYYLLWLSLDIFHTQQSCLKRVPAPVIIIVHMKQHDINVRIKRTLKDTPGKAWFANILHNVILAAGTEGPVECDLLVTEDKDIKKLNARYRKIDRPTDVLSFANASDLGDIQFIQPPDGIRHLGEIVISFDQVKQQALQDKVSNQSVCMKLIVHGVLHLFGYDHEAEDDALVMEAKEAEIIGIIDKTGGVVKG